MAASNATGLVGLVSKRIGRYVNHDDVLVRFVSLWVVVASVFTAAWVLSYLFLPRGCYGAGTRAQPRGTRGVSRESSCGCSGGTSGSP
ncbi:hypothetical protein VB779_21145 [Haloarculaceae archaeon H-GB11]|nr:hypothetical protein [Haloarculaceae archaeon H-GB11]